MKRESTIFSLCVLMVMTMVTPVQAAIISGWEYAEDGMIVTGVNLSYQQYLQPVGVQHQT